MRILFLLLLLPSLAFAQNCNLVLSGYVIDSNTHKGLELAVVVIGDNEKVAYTDSSGYFSFSSLCVGEFKLSLSHLSCETKFHKVLLKKSTVLKYYLDHDDHALETVVVSSGNISPLFNLNSTSSMVIDALEIDKRQGSNLSSILEDEAGISSLKTGNGIGKPIIHGLFGNRIQILKNEIAIEGQQWGNEHAPEIDPFSIQIIEIVKGASALKYGTKAMGGVVLIENDNMPKEAKLHGAANLTAFSNGLKGAASLMLEGGTKGDNNFTWRFQSSFTKSGDTKTADYFLSNTAGQDASASLNLQYQKNRFISKINFSTYYSKIGILRGSHIGNLSDLETAFTQEEPFFTEDEIQFRINNPRQEVFHNTLKLNHLQILNKGKLKFIYAFQSNNRKEFDIRRTSEKPSLFLTIQSQEFQSSYQNKLQKFSYELGLAYINKVNFNDANLNVKALIPNYRTNQLALFSVNDLEISKRSKFEFGARYEYINTLVKFFEAGNLKTPRHLFHNYAGNIGFVFKNNRFQTQTNLGFAQRSPEINELYSNGLHHGAAAIELGDVSLQNEKILSFNQVLSYKKDQVFQAQINPYYQYFPNYIYLQANEELQLTIRGAFPVYAFQATKASIWGIDFFVQSQLAKNLNWTLQAAFLRGRDLDKKENLSFMPADNVSNSLVYDFKFKGTLENISLGMDLTNVWQQIRTPEFDFTEAPSGYALLGASISTNFIFQKTSLFIQLEGNNILNTTYRDYLNRWRYFADDIGVNIALRTKLKF